MAKEGHPHKIRERPLALIWALRGLRDDASIEPSIVYQGSLLKETQDGIST